MKLCWHRYTKWESQNGVKFATDFHGIYHENKPVLESKVCFNCGKVKWRVVK